MVTRMNNSSCPCSDGANMMRMAEEMRSHILEFVLPPVAVIIVIIIGKN